MRAALAARSSPSLHERRTLSYQSCGDRRGRCSLTVARQAVKSSNVVPAARSPRIHQQPRQRDCAGFHGRKQGARHSSPSRAFWAATLRLAQGLVMSDTPMRREPPPTLDRVLAAYERRAQLIAQLHEQAIATANDLSARQNAIKEITNEARRRKAEAWLIAAGGLIVAAGCILAVLK
jgi:hypothetical protein